jgi:hypothetical protein
MIFNANNSYLFYEGNFGEVTDYYQYIISLIQQILKNQPEISVNITLCGDHYTFENSNKTIRININYDHTLVKESGVSLQEALPGEIPTGDIIDDEYNNYLVKIERKYELDNADIIIDYSIPNIQNVKGCNLFKDFSKKHVYISPYNFNSYFVKENRNIQLLTTFINTNESRPEKILKKITEKNIEHTNVNNLKKDELQKLYKNTKVMINAHKSEYHHTFEELQVLPALQCGVIVISEISPLIKMVPYNDYVIWTSYDKIVDKTIEVMNNYDHYHNLIFTQRKMVRLDDLNDKNYATLNDKIIETAL